MAVYFITGTTRGLGRQIAFQLLQQGHSVVGVSRSQFNSKQQLLGSPNYQHVVVDLSDEIAVTRFIETEAAKLPVPDCIILNAALIEEDIKDGKLQLEVFMKSFNVNLFANFRLAAYFLPLMEKNGGTIACISSFSSIRGLGVKSVAYPATKAALNMIFEVFRLRLATQKIKFISILPGRMVETEAEARFGRSITYSIAAKKSLHAIAKGRQTSKFPILSYLIINCLRLVPDSFLATILRKL